jgi:hypothetical protein
MGNPFKKPKIPKGPSASELRAREEAARQKERDRIAQENAAADAKKQQDAEAAMAEKESRRQAFAGQLAGVAEDEDERKRFLRGV